jgi:hypothetical protein
MSTRPDQKPHGIIDDLAEEAALPTVDEVGSDLLVRTLRSLAARPLEPDAPAVAEVVRGVAARIAAGPMGQQRYPYLSPSERPDELGRLGGYRILRVLGEGGMGTVFAAEDVRLGRAVALKTLRPELSGDPGARQRFLREARVAATVAHDHVVPIFAVDEVEGVPFLVMPLLQGESLLERLGAADGSLPLPEVLAVGRQIADGLAAAHRHGVIHRDVKPGNVFLERGDDGTTGRVRLLDFGLARAAADATVLTRSGVLLGTPAYIAPEQAAGQAVDCRADLFSLGCVLYHMATGRRPFPGPDPVAVLWQVGQSVPPAPRAVNPRLPASLSRLIVRLMEKRPERRPGSARQVADELGRIAAPPSPAGRGRVVGGLLIAACLAALAGVIIIKSKTPDGRPVEVHVPDDRPVVVDPNGGVIVNPPAGQPTKPSTEVPPPPSAGEPPVKPAAFEPVRDFVVGRGLTGEQFDTWLKMDADGFRLHWLDMRFHRGQPQFAAVAVKTDSRQPFVFRHRIPNDDPDELVKHEKEMEGYRAVWDWRYKVGKRFFRSRLWTKDGQGSVLVSDDSTAIVKEANRVIKDGFNLSAITPWQQQFSGKFVLTTNSERRPMTYQLASGREQVPEYVEQITKKGWSLDQLTAYGEGDDERFIVIASKNVDKPARTVEWDILPDKLPARVAEQKRNGLMPWCLTAYGSAADHKYAVIWCPFESMKE